MREGRLGGGKNCNNNNNKIEKDFAAARAVRVKRMSRNTSMLRYPGMVPLGLTPTLLVRTSPVFGRNRIFKDLWDETTFKILLEISKQVLGKLLLATVALFWIEIK